MTRDEQLIRAALEMAASRVNAPKVLTEGDAHRGEMLIALDRAIRAIDPAEVLAKVGDERCAKCGHPRSNHPYRHPFVSMGVTQ